MASVPDGFTMRQIGDKLADPGNQIHRVKVDLATESDRLDVAEERIAALEQVVDGLHSALTAVVQHLQQESPT